MAKLTLADVSNILGNPTSAAATINANNTLIETALENTLSRNGAVPNTLSADLDANGQDVLNVGALDVDSLTIGGETVQSVNIATALKISNNLSELSEASKALAARANLGLAIGTNVQAQDAALQSIANLTTVAGNMIYTIGSDTYATADLSAFARTLLDDLTATDARTTLGAQTLDAALTSISGLTTAADQTIYTTGLDTYATTSLTSFARTILDDAAASDVRTTLGLGTSAVINTGTSGTTIPLLDGSNTWSNAQTIAYATPTLSMTDTDTGATTILNASSGAGGFFLQVDNGSVGSAPTFRVDIKTVAKLTISETAATLSVPLNLSTDLAITEGGTGASTAAGARTNLGVLQALTGTATFDPPSLADAAGTSTTVTVTGAALGDVAVASFSLSTQGITVTANVTSADTVTVRFQNETGGVIDLASGTLKAVVFK